MNLFTALVFAMLITMALEMVTIWLLADRIRELNRDAARRLPPFEAGFLLQPWRIREWRSRVMEDVIGAEQRRDVLTLARVSRGLGIAVWTLWALAIVAFLFFIRRQ